MTVTRAKVTVVTHRDSITSCTSTVRYKLAFYTLQGTWEKGKRHGYGVERRARWVYEGEWKDDKKTGYGVLRSHRGATYEGTWLEGTQDGYGVETYADGGMPLYHTIITLYVPYMSTMICVEIFMSSKYLLKKLLTSETFNRFYF